MSLIASLIKEHGNVESAILNAEKPRKHYAIQHIEMKEIISEHFPYSTVNELVKQLAKATE